MLTIPLINLNGTDGHELLLQNRAVLAALRLLVNCMSDAHPHGRDFQTSPPQAYGRAREEAGLRLAEVNRLIADYEAICINLNDQLDALKR